MQEVLLGLSTPEGAQIGQAILITDEVTIEQRRFGVELGDDETAAPFE